MILLDIINPNFDFMPTSNGKCLSRTHKELGEAKIFFPKTVTYAEVAGDLAKWLNATCEEGKVGDQPCYFCGCDRDNGNWVSLKKEAQKAIKAAKSGK